jgi:hypothetical protein
MMTDGVLAGVPAVLAAPAVLSLNKLASDKPQLPSIPALTNPRRDVMLSELMIHDICCLLDQPFPPSSHPLSPKS